LEEERRDDDFPFFGGGGGGDCDRLLEWLLPLLREGGVSDFFVDAELGPDFRDPGDRTFLLLCFISRCEREDLLDRDGLLPLPDRLPSKRNKSINILDICTAKVTQFQLRHAQAFRGRVLDRK